MLRRYQLQRESLGLIPEDCAPALSLYFWVTLHNQLKCYPQLIYTVSFIPKTVPPALEIATCSLAKA